NPPLKTRDIFNTFVGLRPLIRARPGEPSSLSREFKIFASPSGLLSVAGGKFTTYRRMAEIITDTVAERLGRRRLGKTRHLRLDGAPRGAWAEFARTEANALRSRYGLTEAAARHLVDRYGRRAAEVAAYLANDPASAAPVMPGEPDLAVEFVYQREHEMAL